MARIVAAERGIPVSAVEKHRRGSWLWEAAAHPLAADARREPSEMPGSTDVVVIGLGLAGRAAAEAATEAGASVVGVDRRAGATVVGLSPNEDGGWVVLVQSTAGSAEIRDGRRDRRHRRLFRAARASFHRGWQAGRRDDR